MDRPGSDSKLARSIHLPPELMTAVFSQISPARGSWEREHVVARLDCRDAGIRGKEVLHNVSLTCWSFHNLALPIRFRRVEIYANGTAESKATEIFARLAASERLRNFVKVVSLTVYKSLPKSAEAILCGIPNLEEIRIETPFRMTQPLYDHICSRHSLHRLEIAIPYRAFPNEMTPIAFGFNHMSLQAIVVNYRRPSTGPHTRKGGSTTSSTPVGPWDELPPWLVFLALSSNVHHLHLPVPGLRLPFAGFTSRPIGAPSSRLSTLEITTPVTMPEKEEFWGFVKQASSITTLILDGAAGSEDETTLDPPLPPEFLSALRHFEGDWHFAKLIVPGRPVSTITLDLPPENDLEGLRPLSLSAATIRSFRIADLAPLDLFCKITIRLPDLEELDMSIDMDAKDTQVFNTKHPPVSHILANFSI